ncbi:MAG TPA: glycosyltransferase family 2 protein, partial [bacterium]|nr:glycosyltransferase family 2 protein [bacterium]
SNDYPPGRMEVLVIDGASTDSTRERIAQYQYRDARVRLIENPERITPCALNRGIAAARGEIIARIDAHAAIAPDYLRRSVEHLLSSGADNVGGVMRTLPQDPGWFAGPIVAALSHPFGVGNSYFRIGSAEPRFVDTVFGGCWRREVFDRVGGFNSNLRRSQDMEFSLRLKAAGGRTLLVPAISSDYYARSRMGPLWRHNFANGQWAILPFLYSSVVPVALRHLVPLLFVLSLGLGAAMMPWGALPLSAVAVPYTLANLAASFDVAVHAPADERRWVYFFRMSLVFLSLHLGYGLGSLAGLGQAAAVVACRLARANRSEETTCIPQP